jgi:transposase-like protein
MAGFLGLDELFKSRHFDREVIVLCVRWYLRFKLSYRDLVEMMAERGRRWLTPPSCAGCGQLPADTKVRSSKYLNNLIEQDHRGVKLRISPMLGFKWFTTAAIVIAGIELLRRIHKGQFNLGGLRLKDRSTPAVWNAVLAA